MKELYDYIMYNSGNARILNESWWFLYQSSNETLELRDSKDNVDEEFEPEHW